MHCKTTFHHLFKGSLLPLLVLAFYACDRPKPPAPENPPVDTQAKGIYILNEGLFQLNNTTLSYYDFEKGTFTEDIFLEKNHRGLGDTGSDLKRYGSKLYCVVNNSHRVEIMQLNDATSIKAISLQGKQPRKIAFHKGKAYVSCFDGDVVRIDTTTLEIDGTLHSGLNPDGVCVCNGKLYVANSGGLNSPTYNNTISVIDLETFTLSKNITVALNPCVVQSYDNKFVYVASRGNYGNIPYAFQKIDAQTDELVKDYNLQVLEFTIFDHYAYLYNYDFNTSSSWIKVLDLQNDLFVKENFITDGTNIATPYNITINPLNQDVYIADAGNFTINGTIYCFSKEGKKKYCFEAGINPCKMLILP